MQPITQINNNNNVKIKVDMKPQKIKPFSKETSSPEDGILQFPPTDELQ